MSFLKNLEKKSKEIIREIVKQKPIIVKQLPRIVKQNDFDINPQVKSIRDIPNTNIITSGKLLGIRLRANKKGMLRQLKNYINKFV